MAKNEQLIKLIESIVRKEVARIAPTIIRETMTRVMGNMILEAADSIEVNIPSPTANSNKRRALQENTVTYDTDDWSVLGGETMTTQNDIRQLAPNMAGKSSGGRITLDSAMTESGNVVSIVGAQIPEAVDRAINKDYRALMKRTLINGHEL